MFPVSGLSKGAIVAIATGCIAVFVIVMVMVTIFYSRRTRKPETTEPQRSESQWNSPQPSGPRPPQVYSINQNVFYNSYGQTMHVNSSSPPRSPLGPSNAYPQAPSNAYPPAPFPMPSEPPPDYEMISSYTPQSVFQGNLVREPHSINLAAAGPSSSSSVVARTPATPISPGLSQPEGYLSSPFPDLVSVGFNLPSEPPSYSAASQSSNIPPSKDAAPGYSRDDGASTGNQRTQSSRNSHAPGGRDPPPFHTDDNAYSNAAYSEDTAEGSRDNVSMEI